MNVTDIPVYLENPRESNEKQLEKLESQEQIQNENAKKFISYLNILAIPI